MHRPVCVTQVGSNVDLCLTQFSESEAATSTNTTVVPLSWTEDNRAQGSVGRAWSNFLGLLGTLQPARLLLT